MRPAVRTICDEHESLREVLRSFQKAALICDTSPCPDFALLRASLAYMAEFPERSHHAKEGQLLFPRIRERCPPLAPVLDRLAEEHERIEFEVSELENSLDAYQLLGVSQHGRFDQKARNFVDSCLGHMEVEERYILPVAEEYLTELDWASLDAAFASDPRGPLLRSGAAAADAPRQHLRDPT
jgi:hemerythrin-like domain-containing protein